ncbi:tetratricopeptide repeat protein [Streptomyces sp. NPDC057909]|uniref:tetratricopeptide repeat protein n=1 Tax=Streptomyces sp. NPDC057909 TaxID=3346277 RepID=UPI0036E20342
MAADTAAWAALLDGCGQAIAAENALRRALAILTAAHGPNHHDVASITHNLAAIQHRQGNLTAAIDGYTQAIALKEHLLGPDHPELATTLIGLAAAWRSHGNATRAAQYYDRTITVLSPHVTPDHPILTLAQEHMARTAPGVLRVTGTAPDLAAAQEWVNELQIDDDPAA